MELLRTSACHARPILPLSLRQPRVRGLPPYAVFMRLKRFRAGSCNTDLGRTSRKKVPDRDLFRLRARKLGPTLRDAGSLACGVSPVDRAGLPLPSVGRG